MKRTSLASVLAVVVAAGGIAASLPSFGAGRPDLVQSALSRGIEHQPNEALVQFRPDVTQAVKQRVLARVNATRVETVAAAARRSDGNGDLELVRIAPGLDVATAVRALELEEGVDFAEPNWIYRHAATSNDTYFTNGSLWGMYGPAGYPANQYGSNAAGAWANNHTDCSSVVVGVIDEGVMTTHQDLAANIWVNPAETAGNGADDDGNGYADDVNGWDFVNNDNTVYDGTSDDHATHVAGTIGASGGNGLGVAGVCWRVKIVSAKFLGRNGGTTANAIKAVNYLTDLKSNRGINVVATNNSWGGGGYSQGLYDAISAANGANILFVAAAGNGGRDGVGDNNDATPNYPSNYALPNVIAVAAITSTGSLASFSNYGAATVDLGAPGVGIWSTLPGKNNASTYGSYSRTSMATPHVTGAVALYAATHPGSTAAQIKAGILGAVTPTASLATKPARARRDTLPSIDDCGGRKDKHRSPSPRHPERCPRHRPLDTNHMLATIGNAT